MRPHRRGATTSGCSRKARSHARSRKNIRDRANHGSSHFFTCPGLPHERSCSSGTNAKARLRGHAIVSIGHACGDWRRRRAFNQTQPMRGLAKKPVTGRVLYTRTLTALPITHRLRVFSMPSVATVLVVEDDEAMQRQLQQTLRPQYTVLTASCWTQAHEIRARADVDVVVADVNLTSRDGAGLEVLCTERADVPFVFVARPSRTDEPGSAPDARRPLLAFPSRPVQFRELPRTLEDAIADRRATREPPAGPFERR